MMLSICPKSALAPPLAQYTLCSGKITTCSGIGLLNRGYGTGSRALASSKNETRFVITPTLRYRHPRSISSSSPVFLAAARPKHGYTLFFWKRASDRGGRANVQLGGGECYMAAWDIGRSLCLVRGASGYKTSAPLCLLRFCS